MRFLPSQEWSVGKTEVCGRIWRTNCGRIGDNSGTTMPKITNPPRSPTDHSCGSRNLFFTGRQRRLKSAAGGKSIEYFCGCNESDGNSGDSDDCSNDSDNCSNKTEEHSDWTEEHKQWSFVTNFTVYGCPIRRSALPTRRSSHPNHRNRRPTRQNLDNSEVSHQNFTVIYHTHA